MRGFLAFLFLGLVALGAGAVGYNIGVSQAVTTTAAAGGASVVYAGPHLGAFWFFPFGFFLFPLFLFAFFGFLAFAFGGRRHRWHRGWDGDGPSGFGPGARWDARRQWVAEQHRRLHEEEARNASAPAGGGPATPYPGAAGGSAAPSGGPSAG